MRKEGNDGIGVLPSEFFVNSDFHLYDSDYRTVVSVITFSRFCFTFSSSTLDLRVMLNKIIACNGGEIS